MPVELRKRKAPPPPPEPPAKKKATKAAPKAKGAVKETVKEAVKAKPDKAEAPAKANGASSSSSSSSSSKKVAVGDTVDLAAFGGDVTLNDGTTTTLASLVEKSGAGVVLFTYPKASTPGCTNQACLFRDSYEPLTAGGLAIYGLSRDSPKANTTFKEKQKLPYPLLCDPGAGLIGAIGLKKAPSGTQRGVFVVDKKGKVLLAEPGSPAGTVEAVKKLVASGAVNGEKGEEDKAEEEEVKANGDDAKAEAKEDAKDEGKKEDKKEEDAKEEDKKEEAEKEDDKKEDKEEEKKDEKKDEE